MALIRKRRTHAEVLAEKALDTAMQRAVNGKSIMLLDIPKAYRVAADLVAAGSTVEEAAQVAIATYAKEAN